MAETSSSTTTDMTTTSMPTELDLAFIIDATSSMSSYIRSAQENMRKIIQDIILSERCLLNVALILYRDHPPQDHTFVIKVHNFTDDAEEAKKCIDAAAAYGGGDFPEAIAPALHAAVYTLTWRKTAVKIALLIADAPPHGLEAHSGNWPDGDPSGHDPVECAALLAERSVTLYTIGCEPTATPYRDFFMALAFKTGGQYIPLANCGNLASVIVGSAKEEISLEKLIAQVHEEVMREAALRGGPVDETELTRRIHEVMQDGGAKARRLKLNNQDGTTSIPALTPAAEHLSTLKTLKEVREKWVRYTGSVATSVTSTFGGLFGCGTKVAAVPSVPIIKKRSTRTRIRTLAIKKKPIKRKAAPAVKPIIKKKARRVVPSRGSRRSARLAFNKDKDEEESTDSEEMDIAAPPAPLVAKTVKIKTETLNISLKDNELLDISQTRRLVRKCVARNKLEST
ncbi:unnamed protein product [Rotaria sp. Silwood1]|nr:unnamed protein product [Rotaria sp. Silwood1]CAF1055131.1 unnamed protein product [Rotaria sp. Silwood1]CAF3460900.1 unnamed protein product [Rotaria sp. Silwood1]CAF3531611.1 unnamed protein product [Rotaria sp. Silwood1]